MYVQERHMHETSSRSSKNLRDSEAANLVQETTAREVGEIDSELQAEHVIVIFCVCVDVDDKFRWWDLLGKFDGLDEGIVTRLDRALDVHFCIPTACSIERFDKMRVMRRAIRGRLP